MQLLRNMLGIFGATTTSSSSNTGDSTRATVPPFESTSTDEPRSKTIVFLRHGCTYMNEYLGAGDHFGAPGFTDVFQNESLHQYYLDSPLSERGLRQAQGLAKTVSSIPFQDADLIVTSPLTRALQTLHHGVLPHLRAAGRSIPIVALPEAAERVYLISDIGRPTRILRNEFDYVDFTTGFFKYIEGETTEPGDDGDAEVDWWYKPSLREPYIEWRPTGERQNYACPGEPQEAFDARMLRLYKWLSNRSEQKIVLVSHWGVIDWMIQKEFANCQWLVVPWSEVVQTIHRKRLLEGVKEDNLSGLITSPLSAL